jgi:hypothetical protein
VTAAHLQIMYLGEYPEPSLRASGVSAVWRGRLPNSSALPGRPDAVLGDEGVLPRGAGYAVRTSLAGGRYGSLAGIAWGESSQMESTRSAWPRPHQQRGYPSVTTAFSQRISEPRTPAGSHAAQLATQHNDSGVDSERKAPDETAR